MLHKLDVTGKFGNENSSNHCFVFFRSFPRVMETRLAAIKAREGGKDRDDGWMDAVLPAIFPIVPKSALSPFLRIKLIVSPCEGAQTIVSCPPATTTSPAPGAEIGFSLVVSVGLLTAEDVVFDCASAQDVKAPRARRAVVKKRIIYVVAVGIGNSE